MACIYVEDLALTLRPGIQMSRHGQRSNDCLKAHFVQNKETYLRNINRKYPNLKRGLGESLECEYNRRLEDLKRRKNKN